MKVLHLSDTLSAGGAELHLLTLCRYLKRSGIDLAVACLREKISGSRSLRSDFEKENIRVLDLGADWRYDVSFLSRLVPLMKKERADILHTHLPRADVAAALIFRLVKSVVFLCSIHGIYRDRWFGSWAAPLMRRAYRRADGIIAISSAVKDWLHQDLGIYRDKIQVIHYGIEAERFARFNTEGSKNGEHGGWSSVGSIGRLEPGKGFDCLIRAMKSVHVQVPDASLWVAGYDPSGYQRHLEGLIAGLNLQEHVHLVGFREDIPSFLQGMNIFAFATHSEGFGQVLIEAMAAGKPVVASKIAPITEIVLDGQTGFLVNPDDPRAFADAIVWLLTHPEQARQMGKCGQERVYGHFSAQRMADQTLALYEALLRSPQDGRALP